MFQGRIEGLKSDNISDDVTFQDIERTSEETYTKLELYLRMTSVLCLFHILFFFKIDSLPPDIPPDMPPIFFSTIVCYFVKTIWYKFINHLCEGNEIFQILDRGRNTRANLFTRNGLNFTYSNYGCAVGTTFEWGIWLYQVNFGINLIKQLILVL